MRSLPLTILPECAVLTSTISEEEDEETREWEQEQLRRGGLRPESAEPAPKPVYKPAPSMLILPTDIALLTNFQ